MIPADRFSLLIHRFKATSADGRDSRVFDYLVDPGNLLSGGRQRVPP